MPEMTPEKLVEEMANDLYGNGIYDPLSDYHRSIMRQALRVVLSHIGKVATACDGCDGQGTKVGVKSLMICPNCSGKGILVSDKFREWLEKGGSK